MQHHVWHGRPARALALLLAGALLLTLLPPPAARAASSVTVKTSAGDKVADDGNCSLREALQALYTPSNDDCGSASTPLSSPLTLTFDAPGTIRLKDGNDVLPNISGGKIVTITGPVIIDGRDVNGVPVNIFDIDDGILNLANLTLTKGARAITVNNGGTLNVAGVSFLDNHQDGAGGGAIFSSGKVNIAGSLFTANKADGRDGNSRGTSSGGAIYAAGSESLNIAGTIFSGNTATLSGGAIYATSNVVLTDVIFNGNIAEADDGDDDSWDEGGGAIYLRTDSEDEALTITRGIYNGNLSPKGSGGAIFINADSPVLIRDSALNGNLAGTPPSTARSGGAIFNAGKLDLLHTTLLNNGVVGDGGGIANDRRGTLNISNSTLIANAATDQGGGIATLNSQTGSDIRPKTTLLNVTLALNAAAGAGGGLYSQAPNNPYPEVTILGNTIIADSDGPALGGNCGGGAFTSRGGNLDTGTSCGLSPDQSSKSANLAAPAFNGGPIDTLLTMKPQPGSAAIDGGVAALCAAAPVSNEDQTGASRPQDGDFAGGAACDSGALETGAVAPGFGSTPVQPGPISFGNTTVGSTLAASLSVFNTGDAALKINAATLSGINAADFAVTTATPISLAPGAPPTTIGLTCKPTGTGARSAGLTLSTNDPTTPTVLYDLECNGTPVPTAGFGSTPTAPGPLDLGSVRLGQSRSATLALREIGTATLNITGATLAGLDPGEFNVGIAGPITIADGAAAVPITVSCTPTALGARSATLTASTNDPLQPTVSFSLSCVGVPVPSLPFDPTGAARPNITPSAGNGPYGVHVSPDGRHIYVADPGDSALTRFARDAQGFLAAGPATYKDGVNGGADLGGAWISAVSPDGKNVYVAAFNDDALTVFDRDPSSGDLSYKDRIKFADPYGCLVVIIGQPCTPPQIKGLNGAYWITVSPDGRYVYISAVNSNNILVLARNTATGSLRNVFNKPAVVQDPDPNPDLGQAYGMALSPDGAHLYATGFNSDTLVAFERNAINGRLTQVPGAVYKAADIAGLNGVFRVTVSPDGNFVYTASFSSDSVTAFRRNPATGGLSLVDTYTDGQDGIQGLNAASAVAVSPDGAYLFATGFSSSAVSVFARNQETGELDQVQVIARGANGQPPLGGARDVAVSPDGRVIFVTGFSDNQVTAFALANPKPALRSLDPASATAGAPDLTLTVNGESFVEGAVVTWNGQDLPTTLISSGELRATVAAARLSSVGTATVGARNPAPGGGAAPTTLSFTITAPNQNPVPSIDRAEPAGAPAGGPELSLTVYGAGFLPSSAVLWNGQPRTTTYVSAGVLLVTIGADDLAQPGAQVVSVRNPAPGGGTSNGVSFDVSGPGENPVPAIIGLSPQSVNVGAVTGELILTINGTNFVEGAQARWNGAARPTDYVGAGQLRMALGATDLAAPGSFGVDVVNPGPGGGPSNVATFRVGVSGDRPVPTITGVQLATGAPGTMQITVIGRDFVGGATVRWNGQTYTPSSLIATRLVFSIPGSQFRSAVLVVVNPGPGGGPSNELVVPLRQLNLPLLRK